MKVLLSAIALCLLSALASAQDRHDFEQQVARGIADLSRSRVRQLGTGEWLRERLEISAAEQHVEGPSGAAPTSAVLRARILVHRSLKVSESIARVESLRLEPSAQRYEVELRFEPDAAYGQWAFLGGRYWIIDEGGARRIELTMFRDLLLDAPVDAPHELAWAVMSP